MIQTGKIFVNKIVLYIMFTVLNITDESNVVARRILDFAIL